MLNLALILESSARDYPDRSAFTLDDKTFTFQEVNRLANRVANGLKDSGILKGDKVAVSVMNVPAFPIIYFGILKAGGVVVPLSILLKAEEIQYHLHDSDARAFFCNENTSTLSIGDEGIKAFNACDHCEYFYSVHEIISTDKDVQDRTLNSLLSSQSPIWNKRASYESDPAVIIYTSGTTGRPKGAVLSHNNLLLNAMSWKNHFSITKTDTQLISLPLFHIYAMTCKMNAGVMAAAHNILQLRFDPEHALILMAKHKVSIFSGVPTMYWAMLNCDSEKINESTISENLRVSTSSGAPLPIEVLKGFESRFKVSVLEGYGMSEASPCVTWHRPGEQRKVGSVGLPVWGTEVKIIDDEGNEITDGSPGELCYRGHNVTQGYYKRPDATSAVIKNGWMHSGDVARRDEDGYYYIVDRTKDMIIRGGINIYPREIEEVMMEHNAVSLIAVIGIPDERLGEEIKAFIVKEKHQNISESELMEYAKSRLAAYKYPRIIEFIDALPMGATGKILKRALRDR